MGGALCIAVSMISVYIWSRSFDGSLRNGDCCWAWMPSRIMGILDERPRLLRAWIVAGFMAIEVGILFCDI